MIKARNYNIETHPEGAKASEEATLLRVLLFASFVVGMLYPFIELLACSGLLGTQVWASAYFTSYVVVFGMTFLASFAERENFQDEAGLNQCETILGYIAVLEQLVILAYVDLAILPPNKSLVRRLEFGSFRLGAHFAAFFIHFPIALLEAERQVGDLRLWINYRKGISGLLALLVIILFASLHGFNLWHTQMYFFWSIILAVAAWVLFWIPLARKYLLLCEQRAGDFKDVLAFDFVCRVFSISCYWYWKHYNPTGTSLRSWAQFFG